MEIRDLIKWLKKKLNSLLKRTLLVHLVTLGRNCVSLYLPGVGRGWYCICIYHSSLGFLFWSNSCRLTGGLQLV